MRVREKERKGYSKRERERKGYSRRERERERERVRYLVFEGDTNPSYPIVIQECLELVACSL